MSTAVVLACVLFWVIQEPVAPASSAPASLVRGRVTDAATGKPIRQARVVLSVSGPTPPAASRADRITRTNDDGRFEVTDVPQGRYTLVVSRSRYLTASHGQIQPDGPGKPIDVPGGAPAVAEIALVRAAVITGRVLDDLGDPVMNASVQALRPGYRNGVRTFVPVGRLAVANDLGEYRLMGLPAGEYYVAASERMAGFGVNADADIGLMKMLYPGTSDSRQARQVRTIGGQDVAGVDITLAPAQASVLSGIVTGASGAPAAGVRLTLQAVDEVLGGMGGEATSAPDGSYEFPKLLPGRYDLHARRPSGPGQAPEGAVIPLTMAGTDTVLPVLLSAGGRLRGRVILPEDAAIKPADVRLTATPIGDTLVFGVGFGGPLKEDWTFEWTFLIAPRVIRASVPAGWRVSAVKRGDVDITDTPVVFTDPDDVEVVLSRDAARISGTTMLDGKPPVDYTVIVFPEDGDQWKYWSRFIHTARPDQRGEFRLDALPPGRYLVAAVATVETEQWFNPDYLERLRGVATVLTLEPGARKVLALNLVTP